MLSPPCQNMGGIYHPHPPQDLRPCYGALFTLYNLFSIILLLNGVRYSLSIACICCIHGGFHGMGSKGWGGGGEVVEVGRGGGVSNNT